MKEIYLVYGETADEARAMIRGAKNAAETTQVKRDIEHPPKPAAPILYEFPKTRGRTSGSATQTSDLHATVKVKLYNVDYTTPTATEYDVRFSLWKSGETIPSGLEVIVATVGGHLEIISTGCP